jgi:uncharacterized protein (TIGR02444 family)
MVLSCKKRCSGATPPRGFPVLELDNPFWRFSLAVYAAAGVADECLALQDTRGIDVNLLLFCAWVGGRKIVVTADDLTTIEAAARPWREAAVQPLRATRRGIKALAEAEHSDIAALRKEVAALELRAEQIQQAMLFSMAPAAVDATLSVEQVLRRNLSALLGPDVAAPRLIAAALAHLEKSERS